MKKVYFLSQLLIAGSFLISFTSCPDDDDNDGKEQKTENGNKGEDGKNEQNPNQNPNQGENQSVFSTGEINGRYYVDLGLSVKWAVCNIGAQTMTDYGNLYAWGEVEPKKEYSVDNYKWSHGDWDVYDKYNDGKEWQDTVYGVPDHLTMLFPEDDAAIVNWGDKWRMPTFEEFNELFESCEWEEVFNLNGTETNGRMGTSKINGNKIFLPAAGMYDDDEWWWKGERANYWTSSLGEARCVYARTHEFVLEHDKDFYHTYYLTRDRGISVRAVVNK